MFVASTPPPNLGPVDLGLSGHEAPNARPNSPCTSHRLYLGLALVGGYGDTAGL